MKKVVKIINTKYEVKKDGKNCLYIKHEYSKEYVYSEILYRNGEFRIRITDGGLNFYRLPRKLARRFIGFIQKGYSVYAFGEYKLMKIYNENTREGTQAHSDRLPNTVQGKR